MASWPLLFKLNASPSPHQLYEVSMVSICWYILTASVYSPVQLMENNNKMLSASFHDYHNNLA